LKLDLDSVFSLGAVFSVSWLNLQVRQLSIVGRKALRSLPLKDLMGPFSVE
jgi:hypothetical protein